MVRDYILTKFYHKRKTKIEKTKDTKKKVEESFILNLNEYNASLLVSCLAFICRYLYYGKVEDVDIEQFLDKNYFNDYFYSLRIMMLLLNEKCKEHFENYKEYKISNNFLD